MLGKTCEDISAKSLTAYQVIQRCQVSLISGKACKDIGAKILSNLG